VECKSHRANLGYAIPAVDLVRRSYAAFDRGDLDAVLADFDPEIEWHQAQGLPHGGLYRGRDAVRRNVFEPLDAEWWETFAATPEEFIDGGGQVVVLGRYRGTAKRTGKALDVPFVHVWTVVDGRATRFRQFLDTAGWVEALRG
jgi:ketosteroid isomerase-like protein